MGDSQWVCLDADRENMYVDVAAVNGECALLTADEHLNFAIDCVFLKGVVRQHIIGTSEMERTLYAAV